MRPAQVRRFLRRFESTEARRVREESTLRSISDVARQVGRLASFPTLVMMTTLKQVSAGLDSTLRSTAALSSVYESALWRAELGGREAAPRDE
jgi:hypothetical protein